MLLTGKINHWVSVFTGYWLQNSLLNVEVKQPGLDETACIHKLEDLSSDINGFICQPKGRKIICPCDGWFAAYVYCLSGDDNVSPSIIMHG